MPVPELSDSLHSVMEFGQWIRNADVKAALLGALQGLLITALIDRLSLIGAVFQLRGGERVAMWSASLLLVVSLLAASLLLMSTQLPSLSSASSVATGAFSFPAVAKLQDPSPLYGTAEPERVKQAWYQAWTLSRIAVRKYRRLRLATLATSLAVFLFVLWSVVAALVTTPT